MSHLSPLNHSSRKAIFVVFVIFLAIPAAHAACTPEELKRFPAAAHAMDNWSKNHSQIFTQTARDTVISSFCEAAVNAESQRHIGDDEINRITDAVISNYLDLETKTDIPMKSMAAILNNALGASGMARPMPRWLAEMTITYEGDPDQVRIGDEIFPLVASVKIPAGHVEIQGLKKGHAVCGGSGEVVAGGTLQIQCKQLK